MVTESQNKLNEVARDLEIITDSTGKKEQKGGIACGFIRILKDKNGEKTMRYLRIGDVNIAVLREKNVVLRTVDQTIEQWMLQNGIPAKAAREKRDQLWNSINADGHTITCDEPEDFKLNKGDRVLIGCDGVMRGVEDIILEQVVVKYTPLEVAKWLYQDGYQGTDNITAAVIDIT